MYIIEKKTKIKDPFNWLAILSFAIGIISLFEIGPIKSIIWLLLCIALFILLYFAVDRYKKRKKESSSIHFFPNWDAAPRKYKFKETLQYIKQRKLELDVIGRSCFRLLCGDENEFELRSEEYKNYKKALHNSIVETVQSGGSIFLYIQNPNTIIPYFSIEDLKKLRSHQKEAISSFAEVKSRLPEDLKNNFQLYFSDLLIENSMLRLRENNKIIRFIFDISIKFKSSSRFSKPFVIFEPGYYDFSEYEEEFDYIVSGAIEKERFDLEQKLAINNITNLISKYSHYSLLRNDRSELIVPTVANEYLLKKGSPLAKKIPPSCIQLLVTNNCTTYCKMCDHYKLYDKNELIPDDLKSILDSIKMLGTRNIVISGGEPLSRGDIFQILEHANKPYTFRRHKNDCKEIEHQGLSVGLLTNGIKHGGKHLTKEDCMRIKKTCEWVQISIDSFRHETYKKIRNFDYLDIVLESLHALNSVGFKKIEVCYTIQKDNIDELYDLSSDSLKIPSGIPIRFKFAHGPAKKKDFLCNASKLQTIISQAPVGKDKYNYEYLISMLNDHFFDFHGIASGMPLEPKMVEYNLRGYTCQVLGLTLKIDPLGDVYPCCFLFDDNNSESGIRSNYVIGHLKGGAGKIKPAGKVLDENILYQIWLENQTLDGLRSRVLPIDKEACSYCIRHFYQNEYMNKAMSIFEEYSKYGVAEHLIENKTNEAEEEFWV